ncbi:MAG: hypothetical protein WBM58_01635 [Sedimenticolaceae bacterium]
MKHLIIAGMLALSTSAVSAQPFDYELQIGSTEYDYRVGTEGMTFATVTPSDGMSSLSALMLSANVDGIAPNDFRGTIVKSGPSRISLYEIQRGSPEGIAYRGYHERYAPDTDWDAVAREFRAHAMDGELASEAGAKGDNS